MSYKVDYRHLITNLVPSFLRKIKFLSFLYVFGNVMTKLNDKFNIFGNDVDEFLKYDLRKKYLEKRLNDLFDPVNRQITVTNNVYDIQSYLYQISENAVETYKFNKFENRQSVYVYQSSETLNTNNFTVNVPSTLIDTDDVISATINEYLLSAKQYNINRF